MPYSLYGTVAAIGLIAVVAGVSAGDRLVNFKSAEATVFVIDRTCDFTKTTKSPTSRKKVEVISGRCSLTDDFDKLKKDEDRPKHISGKMVAKLTYVAPQDGTQHTGSLTFDGGDDEFYSMKAGDTVKVLVDNRDLDKIKLD